MTGARALAAGLTGALGARGAYLWLRRNPPGGRHTWARTNHRGEPVTLLAGPAVVTGAALGVAVGSSSRPRAAALLVGAGVGALGTYDDLVGTGDARGLRGHLAAARRGEMTSGLVKVVGIGALGLMGGALVRDDPLDAFLAGGVVAASANLVNLLDLRPGRAIKAALLLGAPELVVGARSAPAAAAALGAGLALLPDDLAERAMLGDSGANLLGALLGVATAARAGRAELAARLAALAALTLASERVSFTRVIESTPGLRGLDRLGRRPVLG